MELHQAMACLEQFGVEIDRRRCRCDRQSRGAANKFQLAMDAISALETCRGKHGDQSGSTKPARWLERDWTSPAVVRPSFTLGGSGSVDRLQPRTSSTCWSAADSISLRSSEVLIEESIIGWKEYEMEVMRDLDDNVVIICSYREPRPDGCAHGRLDHRRPRADTDRQGIPADARRLASR